MDASDEGSRRRAADRSVPVVAAELSEVRRYLLDAPPHHGAGHREALLTRVDRLERELATLRQVARSGGHADPG